MAWAPPKPPCGHPARPRPPAGLTSPRPGTTPPPPIPSTHRKHFLLTTSIKLPLDKANKAQLPTYWRLLSHDFRQVNVYSFYGNVNLDSNNFQAGRLLYLRVLSDPHSITGAGQLVAQVLGSQLKVGSMGPRHKQKPPMLGAGLECRRKKARLCLCVGLVDQLTMPVHGCAQGSGTVKHAGLRRLGWASVHRQLTQSFSQGLVSSLP